jgi:hypothetical protein
MQEARQGGASDTAGTYDVIAEHEEQLLPQVNADFSPSEVQGVTVTNVKVDAAVTYIRQQRPHTITFHTRVRCAIVLLAPTVIFTIK